MVGNGPEENPVDDSDGIAMLLVGRAILAVGKD